MPSIFSKILSGEIPSYQVAEDEKHLAFLDINPLSNGHTLVIPKKETDYILDLEESDYQDLMGFARKVSIALDRVSPDYKRVGFCVIGLEVPHCHIHLIPINSVSDMDFSNPRLDYSKVDFEMKAKQIGNAFELL